MEARGAAAPAPGRPWRAYFSDSRDLLTSVILILPLFVAYQIGVLMTGGLRNGVDFMTSALMSLVGYSLLGYLAVNGAVLLALLVVVAIARRRGRYRPGIWKWMLLESAVYAFFFGAAVTTLIRGLGLGALLASDYSPANALVLSIGAGLYEELVFRLGLMGAIYWLLASPLRRHPAVSAAVAVVVSSLVFSGIHHVGSLGEVFTVSAFTFRFFAGMLFALIYQLRGLGVVVYTHAIYDIIILVLLGGGSS